jgi:hypothetical protein
LRLLASVAAYDLLEEVHRNNGRLDSSEATEIAFSPEWEVTMSIKRKRRTVPALPSA